MGNPYFEPYTMPDGTTRRAIVERVPECLYTEASEGGGYLRRGWIDDRWGEQWFICAPDNIPASCRLLSEASALALCRVACEDWLEDVAIVNVLKIKPFDPSKPLGYEADAEWWPATRIRSGFHKERDVALVTLAHAVADANGVPY